MQLCNYMQLPDIENQENQETPIGVNKRAASGGKRYCALCKNYENQILEDGFRVTLHRLPGGKSKGEVARRKAWLRGLKLHRPNVCVTDNTRICVLHFVDRQCIRGESVPKYYNLEKRSDCNTPKARRPLLNRTDCDISINSACDLDSPEIWYATKIVENKPEPECFYDAVENCDNVVEIQDTEVGYRVEKVSKNYQNDHDYSKMPVLSKTTDSTTQTAPGSLKPEDIEHNDEKTRFYTGYPNYVTFMLFFQTFMKHGAAKLNYWEGQKRSLGDKNGGDHLAKPGRKRRLRPIDEFFMVCVRLRLGLLQEHLGDVFGVSVMTVSRIMNTWINFMFDHMKSLIPWPTKEQILANLPKCFQDIPDSRIVIDATEFFCEKPSSLQAQNLTWSEYKHHNTFKVLVGVAPNGLVTFMSTVWGGHTSDRHITQKDGHLFLPKLEPGDIILADKGFTVADLLPSDIGLNMPPFISKSRQMTKNEFFKTQQIASSRIVVEMKMEQIKNFRVLQTVLPLSEAHLAEQMILICTAMTNLYDPLLK